MAVLILSKEYDLAVNKVIAWIEQKFDKNVLRLNPKSEFTLSSVNISDWSSIIIANEFSHYLKLKDVKSLWIHGYTTSAYTVFKLDDIYIQKQLNQHVSDDYDSILFPLIEIGKSELKWKTLGCFTQKTHLKLFQLLAAHKVGLEIPESYIFTNKQSLLLQFKETHNGMITKSFDVPVYIHTSNCLIHGQRTEEVNIQNINEIGEIFHPSFLQEKINKSFELRIFIFNKSIYSMAIFSQLSENSKIDYRNGDINNTRVVPYHLDDEIKNKLLQFMHSINLNCGSIDMIVTKDNKYVFLEVNPCGQFHFMSSLCNYFIERDIANYFSND